jgi:L-fuculose-phosphate aldolase
MDSVIYPSESSVMHDIVEAGRRMYMRGYVCGNDGNISARVSENEIIITPSGVSKGFMTEDMLIKLDLDGNLISGQMNPSSETKMHIAIYMESSDIVSVCHAHPPVATSFSAAAVALDKAFLQETVLLLGVIPVAAYAAPGSEELAKNAAKFCKDYHGALLEHHGVVTWGDSVMRGLYRMEYVEYTASVTMYSRMLGFNRTLDKNMVDELIALRSNWGISASLGEFDI